MAAEVDFGDRELFEQLDGDEAAAPTTQPLHIRFEEDEELEEAGEVLRERLRDSEEMVRQLRSENQELRRKLKILTRPSGLSVDSSKLDGPLLQILFMNNVISKQYHQEIEDFISSLVQKYEEQQRAEPERTHFNVKPQPSSILLEEDHKVTSSNTIKKIKEAFSVVGSVLYFTNFCLDKLGQPILNENPQLTEGWEIPKYQQVFSQILSLDGQEIQVKAKRPKPHCFNCGSEEHQMKDCPKPRNATRISEKRREFMEACGEASNQNFQQRYHADEVEERFGKFKPGIISEELQDALGVTDKSLPPFIYRMRQLGYPPGWLKEAELEDSGLALYDGKDATGGETEDERPYQQNKCVTYDVSKLINYPGFNMSTPSGISDEWRIFGSIPMQPSQQKDVFASYLSNFQAPSPKSSNKRSAYPSSSHNSKKVKGDSSAVSVADMDMDSDLEMPHSSLAYDSFQFQPPLPPGSPSIATPPPLPRGTPPRTPPNFTSPLPPAPTASLRRNTPASTPSSDAAQPRVGDSAMDEDTLTLEELEEQQRLIWAALEQADSTNSDSDIPADTPLTGNSVTSSPSRNELDIIPEGRTSEKLVAMEIGISDTSMQISRTEHSKSDSNSGDRLLDLKEGDTDHVDSEGMLENSTTGSKCEVNNGGNEGITHVVTSAESSTKNSNPVPDMSKFAAGITPFEFENMAESTGVYLRIRSVLKNSPRNQQKNKKASD
ncbi:zinc finger CCHC domain-containing protein 8 isoform X1 [Trachemys scripta elegans]|uniref:zinc finger CCHC domain-containing protein 8 isoform X1 n=1 Tax=Trachemys scripta elegans TaxID=31138 RepID=UPI001552C0AE|nr:zinc finger CCHC domain-containing protein 8 isoform X1 [Trachemys scripta elegans]